MRLNRRMSQAVACLWPLLFCMADENAHAAESGQPAARPDDATSWSLFILNDNCPDYTWGWDEAATRKAFADIVAAHLDLMNATDNQPPENRNRYNMAVTQEALCFVERYPERRDELIRRVREGRVYVSPFLCNTMWAFNSVEQALRAMYPARRLADEWGFEMTTAHHIEEPSLPWGLATLLANCGIRWLNVPFLKYDSTFGTLGNPPLFAYEGPDGSTIRVIMDPWASARSIYEQGRAVLKAPRSVVEEWLPHYGKLGAAYPGRAILASGTHGDISPTKGEQAPGFAQAIADYNAQPGVHPKLINATLPMFCKSVDGAVESGAKLATVRGSFGHSWDLWPVSLAKYVAEMRQGECEFLAAEALLAVAMRQPTQHQGLCAATRADRERAEWLWAMLSDHAWNGTTIENKQHNAGLRKAWAAELRSLAANLRQRGWEALKRAPDIAKPRADADSVCTIFNPLSVPRSDLVRFEIESNVSSANPMSSASAFVKCSGAPVDSQIVEENGQRVLYFVAPEIRGFGFALAECEPCGPSELNAPTGRRREFKATSTEIDGPFYALKIDPQTGSVSSLIHKASGAELATGADGAIRRHLGRTIYHDGADHDLENVRSALVASGSVLARIAVHGEIPSAGIVVVNTITLYARLDRIDFDFRITKPPSDKQERVCHVFAAPNDKAVLRIETPGAVIRPQPQPEGDLLPWADTKRFAVQGFVDASAPDGPGVTICPLDAYMMRYDDLAGAIVFEAMGNDQNYKEVSRDQNGEREFRFRYSLCAHAGPFDRAAAFAFSRAVRIPLNVQPGAMIANRLDPPITIPARRAIATCFKPADDVVRPGSPQVVRHDAPQVEAGGAVALRVWEIAGGADPIPIAVSGCRKAYLCDLLERVQSEIPITDNRIMVPVKPFGSACVRLLPADGAR